MVRNRLLFLTRPGCGLCDAALPRIERTARWLRVEVDVVDIATDPDLEAEYHLRIPVVLDSRGRTVAEGAIGEGRALLAAVAAFRP